jgi:hypothetical protein
VRGAARDLLDQARSVFVYARAVILLWRRRQAAAFDLVCDHLEGLTDAQFEELLGVPTCVRQGTPRSSAGT